ncbi:uncharacterized protein LOC126661592 [Mercurialis annua]|uniref:uncharacterized protein LOC126661592 n=1 Tax=Mercurialis annua TaxID=3986 RepID=UPI00215F05F5|nr:uncharacterized protein LOC126661592 [Mercurialis annua]
MVALTEECSAILQKKKLPPKLKDPGSFSIPCTIGNVNVASCLCDLGASINLILLLVRKLGITEMKPTIVSLHLADRSVKRPLGIVEDLLVKVDKIYLHADSLVLDMNDDVDFSIILGRPFLAIRRVLIDVQSGKLTFRVGDDIEEFNIIKSLKNSEFVDSCNSVDILDEIVEETFVKESYNEPLEECLAMSLYEKDDNVEVIEYALSLEGNGFKKFRHFVKFEELGKGKKKPEPSEKGATEGTDDTYPVIIYAKLSSTEEEKLLRILRN